MNPHEIQTGVTYHNGRGHKRTVVGQSAAYIEYKTPRNRAGTTGVLRGEFAKWAKGIVQEDGTEMLFE